MSFTPFSDLRTAASCLTRFPVAGDAPAGEAIGRASWAFPVIGTLVGMAGGVVYALAASAGLTALISALLAVTAMAWISGGLHEDGLADAADGLGGGKDKHSRIVIMRDPRIGSFGALALILAVGLRVAAIAAFGLPPAVASAVVASAALSRAAVTAAMALMPPADDKGLAAGAGRPGLPGAGIAVLIALAVALFALPAAGAVAAALAAGLGAVTLGALAQRALGGQTGDILGAIQQVAEIAALLALVAFAAHM